MQAPGFWWHKHKTLAAMLLAPFSWVYATIAARRMAKPAHRAAIPVICIGNFTAGGAGKTPTAIALAAILQQAGQKPFFLSRGYGGSELGPLVVDQSEHSFTRVGDEPLLLARHAPTIIARDRIAGAKLCEEQGATVILMDDGMQNPALAKTLTLAVIDGKTGIGNGMAIPAGPLRMAMSRQWKLADAVLVIGAGALGERMSAEANRHGKKIFQAELRADGQAAASLKNRKVLAFAGIGRPDKFFDTLRMLGAKVEQKIAFADHHAFTEDELTALLNEAESKDLLPVTTEKDYIRVPATAKARADIAILPVELAVTTGDLAGWLLAGLKQD